MTTYKRIKLNFFVFLKVFFYTSKNNYYYFHPNYEHLNLQILLIFIFACYYYLLNCTNNHFPLYINYMTYNFSDFHQSLDYLSSENFIF